MAVTLTNAARSAACDAIVDLLDVGSGDNATMSFQTSADLEVCVCDMSSTAFGAASNGVATAAAISQGVVANSGNPSTITKCLFKDQDDAEVFRCAVGSSGSDINLSSVEVNDDDTIDITSLTFTVPAS